MSDGGHWDPDETEIAAETQRLARVLSRGNCDIETKMKPGEQEVLLAMGRAAVEGIEGKATTNGRGSSF